MAARITSRDFKRGRSAGLRLDLARWKEFGLGLALGLSLSVAVLVWQNYRETQAAVEAKAQPKPEARATAAADTDETGVKLDFYDRLQNIEVQVPEKAQPTSSEREPAAGGLVERPGVYVVQAGSFRRQEDADRVQAQLRKLGIEASVQKVQVDQSDVFRVRIGPIPDVAETNRIRARLRAAEFESSAFRIGD